jgi:hypothetical protein
VSKTFASMITRFVISDPVTLIGENLFAVQSAVLCLKVLDVLYTGAQQIAAGKAAGTISVLRSAALSPKTKCDLQADLPSQERRELYLEHEPQLGTSANQCQFLGELLRNCSFFAHLVLRHVRAVDSPSNRLVDQDSACKKSNIVQVSQTLPRSSLSVLRRRLPLEATDPQTEAPSSLLHTLWVEVGCRHVRILVSEKERHDYGQDSKPAL